MHVLGASSFHVGQSGVPLVSGFRVLASAAIVIVLEITAMSPAVVGIVVSPLGTGGALAPLGTGGALAPTRLLLFWRRGLRC